MPRKKARELPVMQQIHSFDEVPDFQNEDEEDEFWSTHDLGQEILDQMAPPPEGLLPPPRSVSVPRPIRLEWDTVRRLKALAARKGKGYQALLNEYVLERLEEEEKREGLARG